MKAKFIILQIILLNLLIQQHFGQISITGTELLPNSKGIN